MATTAAGYASTQAGVEAATGSWAAAKLRGLLERRRQRRRRLVGHFLTIVIAT